MAGTSRQALILASKSATRRQMLEAAGLQFRVESADVDEVAIRAQLEIETPNIEPGQIAVALAAAKAEAISRLHPHALVIGADQVLALDSEIFTKAVDLAGARGVLAKLCGRTHSLESAVVLATDGAAVWRHVDAARLTMRRMDDAELQAYLDRAGADILHAVGCYELEGLGVNLFERIEGDYFTILGLPLLALLGELRQRGVGAI